MAGHLPGHLEKCGHIVLVANVDVTCSLDDPPRLASDNAISEEDVHPVIPDDFKEGCERPQCRRSEEAIGGCSEGDGLLVSIKRGSSERAPTAAGMSLNDQVDGFAEILLLPRPEFRGVGSR